MKLNKKKVATLYSCWAGDEIGKLEYGWYESGRAFIAHDGELYDYAEAYDWLLPKDKTVRSYCFIVDNYVYYKSLDGIVRYLINKYNK